MPKLKSEICERYFVSIVKPFDIFLVVSMSVVQGYMQQFRCIDVFDWTSNLALTLI